MKIFNNIQELWYHFQYCYFCKTKCRHVQLTVGPEDSLKSSYFGKVNTNLAICTSFNNLGFTCNVNCLDNSIIIQNSELQKLQELNPYFYAESRCLKCRRHSSYSSDIEISISERKIGAISLEREIIIYRDHDNQYDLDIKHDENIICCSLSKEDEIKFPVFNIDWADQNKVVNKIKTLLIFS